jgi:hypothetical protein
MGAQPRCSAPTTQHERLGVTTTDDGANRGFSNQTPYRATDDTSALMGSSVQR